jgi:hypothetical protein
MMAKRVLTTRTERGCAGQTLVVLFLCWNFAMAFWLFLAWFGMADTAASSAERAGRAIGLYFVYGRILTYWILGAIVLGILIMLTPSQTIIEEDDGQ